MSKIITIVLLLVFSQIATSQELSRSRTYSSGIRETVVTSTSQPQDDPIGKRSVASRIAETNSSRLVRGSIKQPLAAFVMVEVELGSKGKLISAKVSRPGYTEGYDKKALDMVRSAAPYQVPDYYKGGRFFVNIAFDYDGGFKMQEHDK